MPSDFCVLSFSKQEQPVKLFWTCLLPAKIKKKIEETYRWEKFTCKREQLHVCQSQGLKISLPYTKKQWKMIDVEKASEKLKFFLEKEEIFAVVAEEDELLAYLPKDNVVDGKQMKLILLNQWIEFLIRKHHIKKKEMRLFIIDGGDEGVRNVLRTIYEDVNYMTVLTDRKDYFEQLSTEAYDQTGLMIELVARETTDTILADIVIDFDQNPKRNYRLYPKNSFVIDMEASKEKIEYITIKRPDINYYHRLQFKQDGQVIDDKVLQAAIVGRQTIYDEDYQYYNAEVLQHNLQIFDSR